MYWLELTHQPLPIFFGWHRSGNINNSNNRVNRAWVEKGTGSLLAAFYCGLQAPEEELVSAVFFLCTSNLPDLEETRSLLGCTPSMFPCLMLEEPFFICPPVNFISWTPEVLRMYLESVRHSLWSMKRYKLSFYRYNFFKTKIDEWRNWFLGEQSVGLW